MNERDLLIEGGGSLNSGIKRELEDMGWTQRWCSKFLGRTCNTVFYPPGVTSAPKPNSRNLDYFLTIVAAKHFVDTKEVPSETQRKDLPHQL